jgi:O-methyltransferase involved in polyketide biosynthesis
MEKSYEKISPTAKFVAYLRTFTDIPFTKEIAAESGAETTFQELAGESAESIIQFSPLWEARYKATDRILAQCGITQILEIAAGLSPRGLARTENSDVIYVATDLPQILEEEQAIDETILAKLNSRRPNLHFQVANALDRESLSKTTTFFKSDQPIGIITEGLLPYLDSCEKETTANNIRELLRKYDGIWITDVSTQQSRKKFSQADEYSRQRIRNISRITERDITGNNFIDENDAKQFFNKAGFTIQEYQHSNVFEDLYSVKFLNLDREETLKIVKILREGKTLILTPSARDDFSAKS